MNPRAPLSACRRSSMVACARLSNSRNVAKIKQEEGGGGPLFAQLLRVLRITFHSAIALHYYPGG